MGFTRRGQIGFLDGIEKINRLSAAREVGGVYGN